MNITAKSSIAAKTADIINNSARSKITGVITYLTFYQPESVDEKHLPFRVTAYFTDEAGNRISNENIIIAGSTSKKPEERQHKILKRRVVRVSVNLNTMLQDLLREKLYARI